MYRPGLVAADLRERLEDDLEDVLHEERRRVLIHIEIRRALHHSLLQDGQSLVSCYW